MHNSSQCAVETAKDLRKLTGWLLKGRGWVTPVQKSRCTLCTIPYCLGSQWIREEQAARRPRHPTSPRPSNVDTCNFMDCLGIQFNSEFHNMKVNPWCFTIILYRECSFSSFLFFFLKCWRSKCALKQGTEVRRQGTGEGPLGTLGTLPSPPEAQGGKPAIAVPFCCQWLS